MNATIRIRRDTADNWTAVNPVLASGEPGLETDTRKVKYGDGATAWNSLAYPAFELTQMGATSGQVLTWDGAAWAPATPASGGVVAWNDITGKPSTFTPSAHNQAASTISDSTSAGRALLTAADVAAQRTALGLGGAAVLNVGTSSGTVAAGDHAHSGVYAAASHTHAPSALTAGGATSGQILMWNGTAWAPSSAYVTNTNLSDSLEPYVTSASLTTTLSDYASDTDLANALDAYVLPDLGATSGQVLTWNGTAWAPATPASGGAVAWNDITGKPSTFTPSAHNQAASTISDSTSAGRALLTAADVAAQRTALGLGGAAVLNVGTSSGTVAAGDHAHSGVYEPVMTAASQVEMEAGTETAERKMSPLRVAQAIAALSPGALDAQDILDLLVTADLAEVPATADTLALRDGTGGLVAGAFTANASSLSSSGILHLDTGTGFGVNLTPGTLSADRTATFPDKSGTVAMTDDLTGYSRQKSSTGASTSSSTTLGDMHSSLHLTLDVGTYDIVLMGSYTSSAATEGMGLGFAFTGTATVTDGFGVVLVTSSTESYGVGTTAGTPLLTGTAGPGASARWPFRMELQIVVTVAGTFKPQLRDETGAAASVTIPAGAARIFCAKA